jgi:hypothetical protein
MKNTVFIHTNEKQMVGAIVSEHSFKRNSRNPDAFDVKIIRREDYSFFDDYEGKKFLRAGTWRVWKNSDLQSFTPTRFMPPELMGYQGKAVVVDPDVFAVGDVNELFERDMKGFAVMAKPRPGHNGRADYVATSVMLLDCAKLKHWKLKDMFAQMFAGTLDYEDLATLNAEPKGTVGHLESFWNDFDRLEADTKLIHNTKRRTQPWKTGLPIDFQNRIKIPFVDKILGTNGIVLPLKYKKHPDQRQEAFFFSLLKECLDQGKVSKEVVLEHMAKKHVRADALDVLARVPTVAQVLEQRTAA